MKIFISTQVLVLYLNFVVISSFKSPFVQKGLLNLRWGTHVLQKSPSSLKSQQNQETYDDEKEINPRLSKNLPYLLSWVIDNGGVIHGIEVVDTPPSLIDGPIGWGLETKIDIPKGQTILSIPRKMCISADFKPLHMDAGVWEVLNELESTLKEKAPSELNKGQAVKLALALLSERCKTKSFFHPYISNLPALFPTMPMFFNVTELRTIEDNSVMHTISERCSFLVRFTSDTLAQMHNELHDPFHGYHIDPNVFGWALAAVTSRAIELVPGKKELVPLIDLANHNFRPNAQIRLSESGEVELFASKDIPVGQEVTVCYGQLSNSELLVNYGFCVWPNIYESTAISFHSDLLQAARILLKIQDEPFGAQNGDRDSIAAWQLKRLMELNLEGLYASPKVAIGGPTMIDGRLLAALRILFANSHEEIGCASVKSLMIWSGNYCRRVERRAISTAIGICFILLRAFKTTIQDDAMMLFGKTIDVQINGKGDKTQVQFSLNAANANNSDASFPSWMYGGKEIPPLKKERSSKNISLSSEMKIALRYKIMKKQLLCEAIARLYGKLEIIGAVRGEQDLKETGQGYDDMDSTSFV